jgi:hypothetical protein
MPFVWKFDHDNKIAVAVAHGEVVRAEVDRYIDDLVAANALVYRKLFDVHQGRTALTADEMMPVAVRLHALQDTGPMGPLAIVLPSSGQGRLTRGLGMVSTAKRPLRLFQDPVMAYRWLAKQPLPPGVGPQAGDDDGTLAFSAEARRRAAAIRTLARAADAEARGRPHTIYRGQADLPHRDTPLNICVAQVGPAWEFRCCDAERRTLGTLLTLPGDEIAAAVARGADPLTQTLEHIRSEVRTGRLAVPDVPSGAT